MALADILQVQRVTTSLGASDKQGVLRALADLFAGTDPDLSAEHIYRVFADRESLASTGVGSGVAIPHGRIAGLGHMRAALAIHPSGVPFDAIDGRPTCIFFALIAPDHQTGEHLKALARISRLLRDEALRGRLREASDRATAYAIVVEADHRI